LADNVVLSAPVGTGATIASDENGSGAQVQWIKLMFGPNGTFTEVTSSTGLPISDAGGSLTVDAPVGTPVAVRISDGSSFIGPATAANQATEIASLASIDGKTPALGQALAAASVPVVLTAAQLSALTPLSTIAATQSGSWAVGITGTVTFSNTSIAVTNAGTFAVQAAQSGTWNIATVTAVTSITNPVAATQSGTWNITNISGTVSLPAHDQQPTSAIYGQDQH
jgi:hypothetical protein